MEGSNQYNWLEFYPSTYSWRENTGWNDKIVILKKTTLQLYFKTFIEKTNSGNLISPAGSDQGRRGGQ